MAERRSQSAGAGFQDTPAIYMEMLLLLREAADSGRWPGISSGREKVILSSTLTEHGGEGGSFTVGAMPAPLEEPAGNRLFPELARCAFELERLLMPSRPPSSTIAVNKKAQFLPHVDSGAGAGQGISLIVGLGDYSGGELAVEGNVHDIRYKPAEFNGWAQRHWTLPFNGERYTLVWFTPRGCEGIWGADRLATRSTTGMRAAAEASRASPFDAAELRPAQQSIAAERENAEEPAPPLSSDEKASDQTAGEVLPRCLSLKGAPALPILGFGTYQLKGRACEDAVYAALEAGYRLIDTASIYKNEEAVGAAVRRWEAEDQTRQGSALIMSKCSAYEMGFANAQQACEESLRRLGRESIDVYVIHWPAVAKKKHSSSEHRWARHDTWRSLEVLYRSGRARIIGVSNFLDVHLAQLLEDGVEVTPMLNQVEVHPFFVPNKTMDFCRRHGIAVQAYSPLGGGPGSNAARATGGAADGTKRLLEHPSVQQVAAELHRTPAQVVLRWGVERGCATVSRSSSKVRITENAGIFDFKLLPEHVERLNSLQTDDWAQKFCWDPSQIQ